MKKLFLFLCILLFSGAMYAQQLTYRFANPRIIRNLGGENVSFDIQVQCSQASIYLWTSQVKLTFNNSAFHGTAAFWGMTLGSDFSALNALSQPKYSLTYTITGSAPNKLFNIGVTGNNNAQVFGPGTNYTALPTGSSWVTLVTVKAYLTDISGDALAGIGFYTAGMDGFQQYLSAASTYTLFTNPNLYDSRNFLLDYTGRFYSTLYGWSSVGGSTDGTQFNNWATNLSTTVWEGAPSITQTDNTTALAKNVLIKNGAVLSIPALKQLTVSGNTEIVAGSGLSIQSTATGTGSLITGSASGSAIAQSYMTTGSWHQVSPPLAGQTVAAFLTETGNVTNIATKNTTSRGMIDYNTLTDTWSDFYSNASAGTLAAGQGYLLRTDANAAVNFAGTITTGSPSVTISDAGTGWNLIGNPFTSAINTNNGVTSFLGINQASFDQSFVCVYVWNQGGDKYDVINYTDGVDVSALGQAFFVKSKTGGASVAFNSAMQLHSSAGLKSAKTSYPEIKLIANNDSKTVSTSIKFITGTSNGLDPGYDAGLFNLGSTVSLYTKLVEDNGVNFMLQCLPNNNFSGMIIPVGIDSKAGGEVVFSSELISLPTDCKVILEDKLSKTFTDLSKNVYKTTLAANSAVADRFQIHTSYQTTGLSEDYFDGKLSAYAIRNIEIRIKGDVSNHAVASLYDVQGRSILTRTLEAGRLNVLSTPNIKTGIYMLFVKDNDKIQGFKIPVNE